MNTQKSNIYTKSKRKSTMKHIKLFENFESKLHESSVQSLQSELTTALEDYAEPGEHWDGGDVDRKEDELTSKYSGHARDITRIFMRIGQLANSANDDELTPQEYSAEYEEIQKEIDNLK